MIRVFTINFTYRREGEEYWVGEVDILSNHESIQTDAKMVLGSMGFKEYTAVTFIDKGPFILNIRL